MKNILIYITILSTALFLTNCGGHNHDAHNHEHAHEAHEHNHEAHNHEHSAESSEPLMFTAYGDSLEIFAEIGKLHAGEESFILAHITKLSNYKPLDVPEVQFTLNIAGSSTQFTAKKDKPGIYRCHFTPAKGGKGDFVCKAQIG